jgi:hypothetical protein
MVQRQAFGRRGGSQDAVRARGQKRPLPPVSPVSATPVAEWHAPPHGERDEELEAWKRARKRHVPWKQISLMASLCFGVASLVLPHSVNDAVQWPLYGLAAISFYVGIRKKKC